MITNPKHLKSLSSEALITSLRDAVRKERECTTAVLHHFREVEARQLHLQAGYDSLHSYKDTAPGLTQTSPEKPAEETSARPGKPISSPTQPRTRYIAVSVERAV